MSASSDVHYLRDGARSTPLHKRPTCLELLTISPEREAKGQVFPLIYRTRGRQVRKAFFMS